MNTVSETRSIGSTLFTKVAMLLTGSMAVAALGSFVGAGIQMSLGIFILLLILFIGGSIGVMVAARRVDPPLAVGLMFAWNFIAGLFLGPTMNFFVQTLGGNTVMLAFLGTAGVMAGCGAIGVLTRVNLSGLGRFLMFVLFGLIIVGIINLFVAFSTGVEIIYCLVGMAIFAGFFIFDFAVMRQKNDDSWGSAIECTMAIFVDFINFLLFLLRLLAAARGGSDRK